MNTPHLDALAAGGTLFQRAYVQYSFCAPSRNSFMTGRRPDATKVWSFMDHFREAGVGDKWVTLPGWFKQNGFFTVGTGKLYHPGLPPSFDGGRSWQRFIYPGSCSMSTNGWPVLDPAAAPMVTCQDASGCVADAVVAGDSKHWCALNMSKLVVPTEDEQIATAAVDFLRAAAEGLKEPTPRPFFLAVGCSTDANRKQTHTRSRASRCTRTRIHPH